jgi:hypothetical protein
MHDIHTHRVLNATRVGKSFLFEAQISVKLVASVRKKNHHTEMPKIKPGTMIMALVNHDNPSTML